MTQPPTRYVAAIRSFSGGGFVFVRYHYDMSSDNRLKRPDLDAIEAEANAVLNPPEETGHSNSCTCVACNAEWKRGSEYAPTLKRITEGVPALCAYVRRLEIALRAIDKAYSQYQNTTCRNVESYSIVQIGDALESVESCLEVR